MAESHLLSGPVCREGNLCGHRTFVLWPPLPSGRREHCHPPSMAGSLLRRGKATGSWALSGGRREAFLGQLVCRGPTLGPDEAACAHRRPGFRAEHLQGGGQGRGCPGQEPPLQKVQPCCRSQPRTAPQRAHTRTAAHCQAPTSASGTGSLSCAYGRSSSNPELYPAPASSTLYAQW